MHQSSELRVDWFLDELLRFVALLVEFRAGNRYVREFRWFVFRFVGYVDFVAVLFGEYVQGRWGVVLGDLVDCAELAGTLLVTVCVDFRVCE